MSEGIVSRFDADPPYYAVIFTSRRTDGDNTAYEEMAARMVELAEAQPGFLGMDSVRDGLGITISYWRDEASIRAWRQDVEHRFAQQAGRERWYADYNVRVARVERAYGFSRED